MSNVDPRILELAKREYGEDCELEKGLVHQTILHHRPALHHKLDLL